MQWGKLRVAIERKLLVFQADPQDKAVMRIHDNFELELHRARRTYEHCFLDGAYDDLDNAGYFVDYERQRNLKLCIGSKTNKRIRAALKRHYSEWWLIFDDQIGYGTAFDFPDQMDIDYDWNKVILLNPTGPTMAYELPTSRDLK
jgi:hypothetical protein